MSEVNASAPVPHDVTLTGSEVPPPSKLGEGLTPVREGERIASLDVLRGFALFGILMMNVQVFSMPMGEFMFPSETVKGPLSEVVTWGLTKWLFEYKFMSLFSLLFGAGFMVQMLRAQARGAKHAPVYLRRLGVLAIFGLIHGFVLWYGDILFVYAVAGLVLLLVGRMNPRLLLAIGAALIFSLCTLYVMSASAVALMINMFPEEFTAEAQVDDATAGEAPAEGVPEDNSEETDLAEDPADEPLVTSHATLVTGQATVVTGHARLPTGPESLATDNDPDLPDWLDAMLEAELNPAHETWRQAETKAYRDGPWFDAFGFRAVSYFFSFASAAFSYGWHAIGMFLCGAALLRMGFFQNSSAARRWQVRVAIFGLLIGVPIEGAQAWLTYVGALSADEMGVGMLLAAGLHEVGALSMTVGLAGCGCLVAHARVWQPVAAALANVGRMALTNYIMQTVIMTFIMYHWGLGYFGTFSRVEQVGLVLAVYAGQLVLSALWLKAFRMGPLEWLWRTLTYLRPPSLLRSSTPPV